ncbi:Kelch domain-containing protein family protein [Dirofilaria immitis]|nr:Kelch domain-containing protein family protein [Dirofilaria immitis]
MFSLYTVQVFSMFVSILYAIFGTIIFIDDPVIATQRSQDSIYDENSFMWDCFSFERGCIIPTMFDGPPEGAEVTWSNERLPYQIVVIYLLISSSPQLDDDSKEVSPVVGHTMIKYNKALIVWGGYYHAEGNDFRYRSSTFLYILPAGLLTGCHDVKWILYHVPHGDVPPSTSGACAVLCGCYIFIFGGYVRRSAPNNILEGYSSAMYVLDLVQERWSLIVTGDNSLIPTPRDKMAGWCYRKKCYYFGGYGPRSSDMPNSALYLRDGEVGGTVPSARAASACTFLENFDSILLFGGRNKNQRLNDLYLLNLSSLIWTQIEVTGINQPEGRTWCSLNALFSNQALLYGGYSNEARALSDFWRIEIKDNGEYYLATWTAVNIDDEVKSCRLWHTAAVVEGQLFVCGGTDALLEEHTKIRNVLKNGWNHSHYWRFAQLRFAWARYILSRGYQALHIDTEYFKRYKLLKILETC